MNNNMDAKPFANPMDAVELTKEQVLLCQTLLYHILCNLVVVERATAFVWEGGREVLRMGE